jgi:DNA-binding NtrC family response regulator
MPDLGGMELATQLRERDASLCVLYISGYTEHAELLSRPLERATYFLAKPFFPRDLTRTVCTILERSS